MYQKCYPKKCEEKKPCKWEHKDECKWDKKDECKWDKKDECKWDKKDECECECECECKWEEKKCCKKCDEPGKAKLKCVNGNTVSNIVAITIPGLTTLQPYSLGSITIDTKKLCNPKTLLGFSAVISNLAGTALTAQGFINVYKTCDHSSTRQLVASLPATGALTLLDSRTFSFQVCADTDCCEGCVNYSFEFVPPTGLAIAAGLTISNVVISALSVERNC